MVGDVTGKGIAAALMMAFSRAVLRAATYNGTGPADALRRMNRVLASEVRTGVFLTAVALELEASSGRVTWASAGHEPVYVLRAAGGEVVALEEAAPMVGIVEPLPTVDRTVDLEPGDRLVLWTDGVTDASAPDGQRFGEPRFLEALRRVPPGADAAATLGAALGAVERWIAGSPPADDVTLVVVECVAT